MQVLTCTDSLIIQESAMHMQCNIILPELTKRNYLVMLALLPGCLQRQTPVISLLRCERCEKETKSSNSSCTNCTEQWLQAARILPDTKKTADGRMAMPGICTGRDAELHAAKGVCGRLTNPVLDDAEDVEGGQLLLGLGKRLPVMFGVFLPQK